MRVLCVGRHPYLSEHLCRYFESMGLETAASVGMQEAAELARRHAPDAIICDYDLLIGVPLDKWEQDPALSQVPIIAVSLTRNAGETHVLADRVGIAGFLYLPTLEHAQRERTEISAPSLPWPGPTPVAQVR